jgi:hypothetical protein
LFLHFHNAFNSQQIAAEYLCTEIDSLQFIGCGDEFWEAVQTSDGKVLRPMTRRRVIRATVLDTEYAVAGWAWLLL